MSEHRPDPLDLELAKLQRDVAPTRDLWPDIAATLAQEVSQGSPGSQTVQRLPLVQRFAASRVWQLAAVLLLMVAASSITYVLTQQSLQGQIAQARQQVIQQLQPVMNATPVSFGYQRLGPDYVRAHADLDVQAARYLATLPPIERTKVERSLADLRRVA